MRLNKISAFVVSVACAIGLSTTAVAPATAQSSFGNFGSSSNGVSTRSAGTKVTTKSLFLPGQGKREFILEVPKNYNPGKSYPVLFGLHGWQHSPEKFRGYANLDREAGDDAIIVYPRGKALAWAGAPYAKTSRSNDFNFMRAIVRHLDGKYNINKNRIYGTGLSNGGALLVDAACHAPDIFDAVVSVAGAYYSGTTSNCRRGAVDTLLIHGTHDDVVRYRGGTRHGKRYASVPATFHNIGKHNGCYTKTPFMVDYAAYQHYEHTLCDADTELYRVVDGGHTWFSNPDAADTSWDFLRKR